MLNLEEKEQIAAELIRGENARKDGLEGRARVCARRAAGIAARAFLRSQGISSGANAYELLNQLEEMTALTNEIRGSAHILTQRVDETFTLPNDTDLLEETKKLIHLLEAWKP